MNGLKSVPRNPRPIWLFGVGAAALGVAACGSVKVAEIDSFQRAVASDKKEEALTFIDNFGSSHLISDLIDLLEPAVAEEVCYNLPSGASIDARRACNKLEMEVTERSTAKAPLVDGAAPANENSAEGNLPPYQKSPDDSLVNDGIKVTSSNVTSVEQTGGWLTADDSKSGDKLTKRAFQCVHDSLLLIEPAPDSREDPEFTALIDDRLEEKVLQDAVQTALKRHEVSKGPARIDDIAWAVAELCRLNENLKDRAAIR